MMKSGKFAALAILGALVINPAFAEEKSAALVNGVSIPQSSIDMRVKAYTAQGLADNPELRKAIREDMINLELMVQEAAKLGLDKDPEVMQQFEQAKRSILVGALMQNYVKNHPISEEQLRQEYEKQKAQLGGNVKQYNVRHILVGSEAEAKDIIAQLGKKARFEMLAMRSMDASAIRGGQLGWTFPHRFVPEFANAMVKLKKGEYTKAPVQSQYGWHVIKLDDVRDWTFDNETKLGLQDDLQKQSFKKALDDLRAKAKIE